MSTESYEINVNFSISIIFFQRRESKYEDFIIIEYALDAFLNICKQLAN